MLTGDVQRIKRYMKDNKKDWHLRMDAKDLHFVKQFNRDLFTVRAMVADPHTNVVEEKEMLDATLDRELIFNRLKKAGRV